MAVNASDRITVNVGGRLFETTTATLENGSQFFKALLGETGSTLAGRAKKRTRMEEDSNDDDSIPQKFIYIDGDPDLFEDILYFFRRSTIRSKTKLDSTRLKDLKTEAEFFSLEELVTACDEAMEAIKEKVIEKLKSEEISANADSTIVSSGDRQTIDVEEGKVVFIVSATLQGKCRMSRYNGYPKEDEEEDGDIPGCYLRTADKEDSGDFQLLARFHDSGNRPVCIAHVGMDHIHVGKRPANYDFRQDLRLCLSPDENGEITLFSRGSGDWHVVYWIGHADAIPQLTERPSKRRRLNALQQIDESDEDEDLSTMMLLAGTTTMLTAAVAASVLAGLV